MGHPPRRNVSGSVYYQFQDQVQSTRVVTDSVGNVCYDADYYPFGQESTVVNTCPPEFKFATYERDSESGLDYGMSRYYSPALGRFISPDLADGLTLPQSLNRYTYAGGDPIDLRDASGMYPQCDGLGGPGHPGPGNGGDGPGSPPFDPEGKPPLSDETLGFPKGLNWYHPFNLGELIIGPQAYPCDFGECGTIGIPFYQGQLAVPVIECLGNPACRLLLWTTLVAGSEIVGNGIHEAFRHLHFYGNENIRPSWAEKYGLPLAGESGTEFATRICKLEYPPDGAGCGKGPGSDYEKLKKWADRRKK